MTRAEQVDAILAAQAERDPFWNLVTAQDNRRTYLERLSDEELAAEYERYVAAWRGVGAC